MYSRGIQADNGLIYMFPGHVYPSTQQHDGGYDYFEQVPITTICAPAKPKSNLVCEPCPSNSFSLQGQSACTCDAGYEQGLLVDVTCLECPPESYRTLSEQNCVPCEGTRILNPTRDGCWIACVFGQYRNPTTNLCEYCPAGYRMVGGTRLGAPASQCQQCAVGTFTPTRI